MHKLPAIYVVFTLLNAVRRGIPRRYIWREFRRQNIPLQPRLSFWLAVCQQANLLTRTPQPRLTRQAHVWLGMPPESQFLALLDAWINAPQCLSERQFRRKLLYKIHWDQPLTNRDQRVLPGLHALGVCEGEKLTTWGQLLIKNEKPLPSPVPDSAWQIAEHTLLAPINQRTQLVFELEAFLIPISPGKYSLAEKSLRVAVNRGDRETLISILEQGLMKPLPDSLRAQIINQPGLHILNGMLIEFTHAADLAASRRNPTLRKHFLQILSPRHVFVHPQNSERVMHMLKRRGVSIDTPIVSEKAIKKRTHFYQSPILLPVGKHIPIRDLLEKNIRLQQALDIWYHTPGCQAEKRRITPLLIEQRNGHTYLSAFCQNRHANRIFRMDRISIPGTINEG